MSKIFFWQQDIWDNLVQRHNQGSLPHAILLTGESGLGKMELAKNLARVLLCQKQVPKSEPCGKCSGCLLLGADNHPDLVIIAPEDGSKLIKVDQIRGLINTLANTSHQGGWQAVIIEQAELMNVAAANSLLKTLEEPSPNTLIVLISSESALLPATIRSRCQNVNLKTPNYIELESWLGSQLSSVDHRLLIALANRSPLKALMLIEDEIFLKRDILFAELERVLDDRAVLVELIEQMLVFDLGKLIEFLLGVVSDLVKTKLNAGDKIINIDQQKMLARLASRTNLIDIFSYQDNLSNLRRDLLNKFNFNHQIILEWLLIGWIDLFNC